MAEKTGIGWTRSTFNPWIGCTEVSPGCDGCYARELDKRHRYGGATHWGAGVPRFHTSARYWEQPAKWDATAAKEKVSGKIEDESDWHTPGFWPVFPSMCDPFDNEVPDELRAKFFSLVRATPSLTWLLLTKRIGNAARMLPWSKIEGALPNVWLGASVVNQQEADRDLPKLIDAPAVKRFVSYEPALGPIDFQPYLSGAIAQIIVGGESSQGGHKARPFYTSWARATVRQCRAAGVPAFVKQMGAFVVDRNDAGFDGCEPESWPLRDGREPEIEHDIYGHREEYQGADVRVRLKDRAGAEPTEWPEDLRVQQFPQGRKA